MWGVHTFWCWVQICGQKFFPLPSALDLKFSQDGGMGPYFLMLSPNLWSKIFPFTKRSGLRIFSGWGGVCTFWCWVQICGQKFFPLPSTLDLEFSQGGGPYFLMLSPNLWSKIFPFTKRSGLRNGILRKLLFDRGGQCLVINLCTVSNTDVNVICNLDLFGKNQTDLFFSSKVLITHWNF